VPAGLWSLTQAALLDHLDRDDPAYALRRLVADATSDLGVPCGLLAVCAAGQPRWTAGSVPDSAVRPGSPLGGRREPFAQDGFCWLPLWRMGQPVGAWLLPAGNNAGGDACDPAGQRARVLDPLLRTAAALLLRDQDAAAGRPGGSHGELIRAGHPDRPLLRHRRRLRPARLPAAGGWRHPA
jgi:hypothetical protein